MASSREILDDHYNSILSKIKRGIPRKEVAKEYGVRKGLIDAVSLVRGLRESPQSMITPAKAKTMSSMKQNGKSYREIADQFDCSTSVVEKYVTAFNPSIVGDPELDHDSFDDRSDSETQYWMGVILANGSMNKGGNRIEIVTSEEFFVRGLKDFVDSGHKISERTNNYGNEFFSFGFCSDSIKTILTDEFCFLAGSSGYVRGQSNLNEQHSFWRGVFDASGGMHKVSATGSLRTHLAGPKRLIEQFHQFLSGRFECFENSRIDQIKECQNGGYQTIFGTLTENYRLLNTLYRPGEKARPENREQAHRYMDQIKDEVRSCIKFS